MAQAASAAVARREIRLSAVAAVRSRARSVALGLAAVVAIQFAAMTALAAVLGTWQDEEYTLATTAHGVGYAVHRALSYELQAPLYFGVLAVLRTLDPSLFFARMFSVVAACLVTLLGARIAQRIWPARDPRIFAALVACNPYVVFAAVEIRLYALAMLVSAALWLAFDLGFLAQERRDARVALVLLAIVAAYLQYFLVFELAGFGVALVVARRWRALRTYVFAMCIAALAFVPLGLVLRSQVSGELGQHASLPGAYGSVFVHPLLDFVIPLGFEPLLGGVSHLIVIAAAAALVFVLVAGRPALEIRTLALVAAAAAVECCYAFLDKVLHYELVVPRHFVALFVPEIAAVYALIAAFRARGRNALGLALACTVALASAASLFATYGTLAKQGDWPRVGAFLSEAARPGDTIAVFPADGTMPLRRYYRGPARVVPFPRPLSQDRYATAALFVRSENRAAATLAALARHGRLWLVHFGGCSAFDAYGCVELDKAVAQHFRVAQDNDFFNNEVVRLEPDARTAYAVPRRARRRSGMSR